MDFYQQAQPDGLARQSSSKGNAALGFSRSIPCRQGYQRERQHSASEDTESDSKSVQISSSATNNSSRSSSFTYLECRSEAGHCGRWLPHEDEHALDLKRSWSSESIAVANVPLLHRSSVNISTILDRQTCDDQETPLKSQGWPKISIKDRDISVEPHPLKLTSIERPLLRSSTPEESKPLTRQSTFTSDLSDSDSEPEDASGDDDIDNDEWSGANDNIEAVLYQAVYPDIDLAAHLVSTMYSTLVLSYMKKITNKVSSWQEKNIITCGTASGTASTTKETAPQETSRTGNGTGPKRNREAGTSSDNIGGDDDDDGNESRHKIAKEQSDSVLGSPQPRFACPFYKQDPVKYSPESGRKACSGPGWTSIPQLKEHLNRVHRPVQCERCYLVFPFKTGKRSIAVSEREQHIQQDDRCPRRNVSLREGINDAEWSRLGEEKQKSRKGKNISSVTTQSPSGQWYEVWVVLFPNIPRPSTPWYEICQSGGPPRNKHFLDVSKNVNEYKLSEIKAAVFSGSDEDILSLLLECDRKKFQLYLATFMAISDAATDSFSNIEGNDVHSSDGSGSWQKVTRDTDMPQQSSLHSGINSPLPTVDFATQTDHSTLLGVSNPAQTMSRGRELSMNGNPQALLPNATYAHENIHAPPQQVSPLTATTPLFQSRPIGTHYNHPAIVGMGINRNPQNIFPNAAYDTASQAAYNHNQTRYIPASQASFPNSSTGSLGPVWSPDVYDMQEPNDLDMASLQYTNHLHRIMGGVTNNQYPAPTPHRFHQPP